MTADGDSTNGMEKLKMRFNQVTQERYDEMLGAVPPAIMMSHGFLVGKAMTHKGAVPAFTAFVNYIGQCWEAEEPMTIAEFKAIGPASGHEWYLTKAKAEL